MKWGTFDDWKNDGYHIKKGSKSVLKEPDSGAALFSDKQVEKMGPVENVNRKLNRYPRSGYLRGDYNGRR